MDPALGDLMQADLLVEGDRIAAVGPKLAAGAAERIDARDQIIIPGLVNAHMHTWQTGLRSLASNWTLLEYFRYVHRGLATLFQPEDLYYAELLGGGIRSTAVRPRSATGATTTRPRNTPTPHWRA